LARHLRLRFKNQEEIGAAMGKHHSTISYYLRKYDEEYMYNPEFRELADWFNQIREKI
jgi:sulfur relay (sulfurtransferase) DsrC/TusE family protein